MSNRARTVLKKEATMPAQSDYNDNKLIGKGCNIEKGLFVLIQSKCCSGREFFRGNMKNLEIAADSEIQYLRGRRTEPICLHDNSTARCFRS
jgi:hypothetical protein